MTNQIVQVEPTEDVFSITWSLGRRCNYDCMYCPSEYHNNTDKHRSLSKLKNYWLDILSKTNRNKYKIAFTGGEVTSNKDFLVFIQWLHENYKHKISQILLTTNGSASYGYYVELFKYVDNISFSTHTEHIIESKFFKTIIDLSKTITNDKFLHVNIMDEYWAEDRIVKYKNLLDQHNISNAINLIDYNKKIRDNPIIKSKLDYEF